MIFETYLVSTGFSSLFETTVSGTARPVVPAVPNMNEQQAAVHLEFGLGLMLCTAHDKVAFDHGEAPLPTQRTHRGAHFMAVSTGQQIAVIEALQGNEGRTYAITHIPGHRCSHGPWTPFSLMSRHRFHDVSWEPCPIANGAYGLRALVAIHAWLPENYARGLSDNAVIQEVANFLSFSAIPAPGQDDMSSCDSGMFQAPVVETLWSTVEDLYLNTVGLLGLLPASKHRSDLTCEPRRVITNVSTEEGEYGPYVPGRTNHNWPIHGRCNYWILLVFLGHLYLASHHLKVWNVLKCDDWS